jgi:hypothetical protein
MANPARASFSLLLLILLGTGGWYARERTRSCIVGVNGADASVTVTGFGASTECETMIHENQNASYLRQSPPAGGVLCEIQRGQKRLVVRDRGALMLIGRGICATLLDTTRKSR